jgi:hypothetical protein
VAEASPRPAARANLVISSSPMPTLPFLSGIRASG